MDENKDIPQETADTALLEEEAPAVVSDEAAVPEDTAPAAAFAPAESAAPALTEAQLFAMQTAAAERAQVETEARDRDFLAALDEVLENQRQRRRQEELQHKKQAAAAAKSTRKGAGIVSLALILILLGGVMVYCLFSEVPNFLLPLKLSPVAAVLVGLELLLNYIVSHGKFRINIPSICISAALVVGCCVMCVALNKTYNEQKTEYDNRTMAAIIYDNSYKELRHIADIKTIEVVVDLNPYGTGREKGIEGLSTDDVVTINVRLAGSYSNPTDFARECKSIIDAYRLLGIPVTNYHFICDDKLSRFILDVEGKYAQDYSESRLAELVGYVYIENYDYLEDLEDVSDDPPESDDS